MRDREDLFVPETSGRPLERAIIDIVGLGIIIEGMGVPT